MENISIAGLEVTAATKQEFLQEIKARARAGKQTFVITPYSEFLFEGFQRPLIFSILNQADLSVPDGIGMFWAKTFLDLPLTVKSYYGRVIEAAWQAFYTLATIIFAPSYIKKALPEKIVGANLIWDLSEIAAQNNWSVYFLGGFGNTAELAAAKLKAKYPHLIVAGTSNKNPSDPSILDDIKKAGADFLLVAFGPIRQEQWIAENLKNLPVKLAIGLGGTFDYLAGKYKVPPRFIRSVGLEWLWRLITQPRRWKRIYNATFGLITCLIRYKVFNSLPMRPNVAVVILNKSNQVLVCERNPSDIGNDIIDSTEILASKGYWQLPQGGIDVDEDLVAAATREAKEETGLENLELVKISEGRHEYLWNNSQRKLFKKKALPNKGQIQQVVYFRISSETGEVKIDNHEFVNHRWIDPAELINTIHSERIGLTKLVQEDLEKLLKT